MRLVWSEPPAWLMLGVSEAREARAHGHPLAAGDAEQPFPQAPTTSSLGLLDP
jgi:hypothetical protein